MLNDTRKRILKLGHKHFGTHGLAERLKVTESAVMAWLDQRAAIPQSKVINLIDILIAKGVLGEMKHK